MEYGVGDGRRNADLAKLAHALNSERVDDLVLLFNEYRFVIQNVGVDRHVVVLQIWVHDPPVSMIDFGRFLKRHADSPNYAAEFLTVRSFWVHDLAAGGYLNDSRHTDKPQIRINFDFHELCAVRAGSLLFSFRRRLRFVDINQLVEIIAPH